MILLVSAVLLHPQGEEGVIDHISAFVGGDEVFVEQGTDGSGVSDGHCLPAGNPGKRVQDGKAEQHPDTGESKRRHMIHAGTLGHKSGSPDNGTQQEEQTALN